MKLKDLQFLLLLILAFLLSNALQAQKFTKITDDPIVSSALESNGCAWGDYDNDGDEDLFISNGIQNNQSNQLFRNEGPDNGFTFIEITEGDLVNDGGGSREVSWGDFDNDGDLDLFVVNQSFTQHHFLYENNGDGTFTSIIDGEIVKEAMPSDPGGWIDYDNDGYLDVFIGNDFQNSLFHGNGDGTFSKLYNGPVANDFTETHNSAWGDFDNDGDMDLYIGNPDTICFLYRNNGDGSFTKNTEVELANEKYLGNACWVDYDNDRDLDLFVRKNSWESNHFIYKNEGINGNYNLLKITGTTICQDIFNYCSNSWADFDNDGDIDCFISNFGDLSLEGGENGLFSNNGDGTFTRITEGEIVNEKSISGPAAWADYDNDGDMDLYACNTFNSKNFFYRNDNDNGNNWIKIKVNGTVSNASGIGTKVYLKSSPSSESVWQTRVVGGHSGGHAQNSLIVHFGLGTTDIVDSIIIQWPSGRDTVLTNIAVNQLLTITEKIPEGYVKAMFDADITTGRGELTVNFTDRSSFDPDNPVTAWSWDFDGDGNEDSKEQNPEFTYTKIDGEKFSPVLIVTNGAQIDTLKREEYIKVHPVYGNLALWGKATASSLYHEARGFASEANDGYLLIGGGWHSERSKNTEWLKVELDSLYNIGKVLIHWYEGYHADSFQVKLSPDNEAWDTVYCNGSAIGGTDTILFTGIDAKYVMLERFPSNTESLIIVKEMEVYLSDGKEYPRILCQQASTDIENKTIPGSDMKIYPNPASNTIRIEFMTEIQDNTVIELIDITGKKIKTIQFNSLKNKTLDINLSDIPEGVYLISIKNNRLTKNQLFIKR